MSNKTLGSFLLVAGTCIGVGMLALPVSTASSGFLHSSLLISLCWLFMYATGLMVMEVYLALPAEPSYISMAKNTIGKVGGGVTWGIFAFLLYSLLAAYITAGGDLLIDAFELARPGQYPAILGHVLWTLAFAVVIFMGLKFADFINRVFMVGLFICLAAILVITVPHIHLNLLERGSANYLLSALPIVFTSLGFHIIIPSLCIYLDGDIVQIKRAIFWGSVLPLLVFIVWEAVVFGIVPVQGANGLLSILNSGHVSTLITKALVSRVDSHTLGVYLRLFLFFALTSSFIGVAYGLFDLLADGCNLDINKPLHRCYTTLLTLLPPFVFAICYPSGFIFALGYAGVCVALVHGLLPVAMVYGERYWHQYPQKYRLFGGKALLLIVALFFLTIIYADTKSATDHYLAALLRFWH